MLRYYQTRVLSGRDGQQDPKKKRNNFRGGKKAFIFYLKAANQNNVDGLYHVARCYQHQIGVQKSFEKALEYYEKAVALGVQNNVVLQEIEFLKSCKQ